MSRRQSACRSLLVHRRRSTPTNESHKPGALSRPSVAKYAAGFDLIDLTLFNDST
jgi:hypothetical protein